MQYINDIRNLLRSETPSKVGRLHLRKNSASSVLVLSPRHRLKLKLIDFVATKAQSNTDEEEELHTGFSSEIKFLMLCLVARVSRGYYETSGHIFDT